MKSVIVILALHLVIQANAKALPQNPEPVDNLSNEESLRDKRGCGCGPHGCFCTLKESDQQEENIQEGEILREKRGCCKFLRFKNTINFIFFKKIL